MERVILQSFIALASLTTLLAVIVPPQGSLFVARK